MPTQNLPRSSSAMKAVPSRTLVAFRVPGFPWLWASSTLGIMSIMAGGLTLCASVPHRENDTIRASVGTVLTLQCQ